MQQVQDATAEKEFASLRAQAALRGHELHRSNPHDGQVRYWARRWGMARDLQSIEAVRDFVRQIGRMP